MSGENLITIERHILQQQRNYPGASGMFTNLLYDIALAARIISREVNKAGLANILGSTGKENVQGEVVQKLDRYADRVISDMNDHTGRLCMMASEERSDPIPIPDQYPTGPYVLLYDPIDGSSNIDVNVSVGTIFSIHRKISKGDRGETSDCLQAGSKQVGAGYVIYGSSTMMVYSTGNGVHGFTLEPSIGEFLLSHENIRIPPRGKYYSVNESNYYRWHPAVRKYVDDIKAGKTKANKSYSGRYIGSLVADFHRNLLAGGIFMYPGDYKKGEKTKGKLRLLYECSPLSYIAEQAGGYGSNSEQNILNIEPTDLHERTPLFIGSKDDVIELEEYIAQHKDDEEN